MSGDGAALAAAQGQMSRLSGLQHRIERAHGGGLAAIRAEVMASVAATQTMAQQARSTVTNAQAAEVALHAASAAARREVTSFAADFYERKIFDPYLRFDSPEDEAAYRQRAEQRQREIEKAMAEGTPAGTLRAAELSIAQLKDAGVHGADQSPEFEARLNGLTNTRNALAARLPTSPQSDIASAPPRHDPTADVAISSDILASLRNAGVVMPDQTVGGHGVSATISPPASPLIRV